MGREVKERMRERRKGRSKGLQIMPAVKEGEQEEVKTMGQGEREGK